MVDSAIFAQFGLLYSKKRLKPIPHDHIPTAIGKIGPMACIIYTIKPAVSRKVGHAGACVFGDCVILYLMVETLIFRIDTYLQVIDFYVC